MQGTSEARVLDVEFSAEGSEPPTKKKSLRGFASMDKEKQREIARRGGRVAHERGTAHEFTSEEARVAGRKGGVAVSQDREHMAVIGREGGQSRRKEKGVDPEKKDEKPEAAIDVTPGIID